MSILQSDSPVTLLGGSHLGPGDLDIALRHAPMLVAVDGGADHALRAGHVPDAVIGDMDSLSPASARTFADRLHEVGEQDTTDFDKALRHVAAPFCIAVGFSGGRFDHALAAVHVMLFRADRPCILIGSDSVTVLCPPRLSVDLPTGTPLSLFPMAPVGVASDGLRWPTKGIVFAPQSRIGTSNEVAGQVVLSADAPAMLVIVPRAHLDAVVSAIFAAPRWPSRAR